MTELEVEGAKVLLNEEGFLERPEEWNKAVAAAL